MKLNNADTQLGITFRVVEFEDADILDLVNNQGKVGRIADCVNADRRQKVALVDARADLSDKIEAAGFKRTTEAVKKDGEDIEVPSETEGQHIKRFIDALVSGQFSSNGWTLPSGDDKVKEKAAYAYLQLIADTCGDDGKEFEGKPCYILNIDRAVRKAGTGLIPKWAMTGATNIINNGSQKSWAEKFKKGYTSGSGIAIDPIAHDDFMQKAGKNATPEEKEAVHQLNTKRLAKCLVEQRRQEDAKRAPEFA